MSITPKCCVCGREFHAIEDLYYWWKVVEGRTLLYHDSCASEVVKLTARKEDIAMRLEWSKWAK